MTAALWWILGVCFVVYLNTVSVSGKATETHINNGTYKLDSVNSTSSGKTKDGKVWNKNEVSGTWKNKGTNGGFSYGVFRNSQITAKGGDGKPILIKDIWTGEVQPNGKGQEKSGVTKDGKKWKIKTSGNSYTSPDGTVHYGWSSDSKTITEDKGKQGGWFWNKKKGKPAHVARPSPRWRTDGGSGWGSGWLFGGKRHSPDYNYGYNPYQFGHKGGANKHGTFRHWRDDSRCQALDGACQHVDKPCAGTVLTDRGLCGGGRFRKCCVKVTF